MRDCASGNLEIPGLRQKAHPGMTPIADLIADRCAGLEFAPASPRDNFLASIRLSFDRG
jgi:hypothetical protein